MSRELKFLKIAVLSSAITACGGSSSPSNDDIQDNQTVASVETCSVTPRLETSRSISEDLLNKKSINITFSDAVRIIDSSVTGPSGVIASNVFLDQGNKEVLLSFDQLSQVGRYSFIVTTNALECAEDTETVGFIVSGNVEQPIEDKPEIAKLSGDFSFPKVGQIITDKEQLDLFFTDSVDIGEQALSLVQTVGSEPISVLLGSPKTRGNETRFIFEVPNVDDSELVEGLATLVYQPNPEIAESLIRDISGELADDENILDSFSLIFAINNPSALVLVIGDEAKSFVNNEMTNSNAEIILKPGNDIVLEFDRSLNEGAVLEEDLAECQKAVADNTQLTFIVNENTTDQRSFLVSSNDCRQFMILPNTPVAEDNRLLLEIDLIDPDKVESLTCSSNYKANMTTGLVDNFCAPVAALFSTDDSQIRQQASQLTVDISVPVKDRIFGGLTDVRLDISSKQGREEAEISLLTNDSDNNSIIDTNDVKTLGPIFREFDQIRLIFDEVIKAPIDDQLVGELVVSNTASPSIEVLIPLVISDNNPKTAIAKFTEPQSERPNTELSTVEDIDGSNYQIIDIRGIKDQSDNVYVFDSENRYSDTINRASDNPLNQLQFEKRFIGLIFRSDDQPEFTQVDRDKIDDKEELEVIDGETVIPILFTQYRLDKPSLSDEALCSDDSIRMVRISMNDSSEVPVNLGADNIFTVSRSGDDITCALNLAGVNDNEIIPNSIYVIDVIMANRIISDEDLTLRVDGANNSQIIGRYQIEAIGFPFQG